MVDAAQPSDDTNSQPARILICDDSKVVRLTATKMLADRFDVVLAEDGEVGWEMMTSDPTIQMVFTDLRMPNLDGFDLILRARMSEDEHIRNMPIVVITGSSEEEGIKERIFDVGATDFISKPFKASTLIARTEAHTSYRKIKKQLQESCNLDPIAGVLNEQGIQDQLEKDCAFVNRHLEKIAVMLFEIDNFESNYDKIGKNAAELVVKEVAKILVNSLRKEDSVGRMGLAQFLVVLPMANNDSVVKLAKRLADRIRGFKLKLKDSEMHFTASAGIASALKGSQVETNNLINFVKQALSSAREVGPDQVQLIKLEPDICEHEKFSASIDALLESFHEEEINDKDLDMLATKLAPLVAQMSEEQKQRLLSS